MSQINYKQKYQELKMKYMESVDAAFRIGFEQGAQQEQQNQMAQQQQQQAEMAAAQAAGMGGQPGQPGQPDAGQDGQEIPGQNGAPGEESGGTELDQHIAQLESMLGQSSQPDASGEDIKKSLGELGKVIEDMKKLKGKIHLESELKKSARAIPEIAKALHKPKFKIGVQASHNMNSNARSAVTLQEKIVNDVMKSWAEEEVNASKEIQKVLTLEGLSKKE